MGGCLGTLVEQAESMGLAQVNVPGEQGTFAPHSDESFGCLDVWVGDAKADGAKCTSAPAASSAPGTSLRVPPCGRLRLRVRATCLLTPAAARAGDQLAGR